MLKKERQEAENQKAAQRRALLDKYGDQGNLLSSALKDVLVTESERFIEYDESGGIKGVPKAKLKSKYPEDVYINNHTSVWGSWWSDFVWGYFCCHSTVKNSYCTGEEGKRAFADEKRLRTGADFDDEVDLEENAKHIEWQNEQVEEQTAHNGNSRKGKMLPPSGVGTRKRNLEETKDGVSEEEMDEYRRKRANASDPMSAHLGKDELVH
jgi:pre-mRNA-processing factor SLU7